MMKTTSLMHDRVSLRVIPRFKDTGSIWCSTCSFFNHRTFQFLSHIKTRHFNLVIILNDFINILLHFMTGLDCTLVKRSFDVLNLLMGWFWLLGILVHLEKAYRSISMNTHISTSNSIHSLMMSKSFTTSIQGLEICFSWTTIPDIIPIDFEVIILHGDSNFLAWVLSGNIFTWWFESEMIHWLISELGQTLLMSVSNLSGMVGRRLETQFIWINLSATLCPILNDYILLGLISTQCTHSYFSWDL